MTVATYAADLLADIADGLEAAGVTVPDHRYVTWGEVAYDCEQLVLAVNGYALGLPGQPAVQPGCQAPLTMLASVHLVRCPPLGTDAKPIPSALTLDAFGREMIVAGFVLGRVVADLIGDDCEGGIYSTLAASGPEGDRVAAIVTMELDASLHSV